MRVQHPNKTQHVITPVGEDPIETEENGIAEVPDALGRSLIAQGWTRTDKPASRRKATTTDDSAPEPDATTDDGATVEED